MDKVLIILFTLLFSITSSVGWSLEMKDLVKRDGVYYKKFTDIPFTGKVTLKTCESNEPLCKELVNLKNGKKDGFGIKFWNNGQLKYKINYANGEKNGSFIEHHYNGQLETKGIFKNNKKDGSWITYHSNGQLASQGNYKNNRKDGSWIQYYSNGSLEGKYVYKDNYVNGLQEFYWDNGQLRSKCIIKNKGRDQHCIGYKKDGSLWQKITGEFKRGIRISNNPLDK